MSALLPSLPSLSSVSRSACAWGASGFGCRSSARALGGFVAVVGFVCGASASAFAASWAPVLPSVCRGCVVRRAGRLWLVSVPVLPASAPAVVRAGAACFRACGRAGRCSSVWGWLSACSAVWFLGGGRVGGLVLVGFSGSRSLPASAGGVVGPLVASVAASGRGVAVGCASGLDQLVRLACPSALVARSVSLVRAVAASGSGCGLVVFPGCACPAGLLPFSVPSRCFCGLGSGSWASAALAAGLGVPVVVFGVPLSSLPAAWGAWSSAGAGVWAAGWRLSLVQRSLF